MSTTFQFQGLSFGWSLNLDICNICFFMLFRSRLSVTSSKMSCRPHYQNRNLMYSYASFLLIFLHCTSYHLTLFLNYFSFFISPHHSNHLNLPGIFPELVPKVLCLENPVLPSQIGAVVYPTSQWDTISVRARLIFFMVVCILSN